MSETNVTKALNNPPAFAAMAIGPSDGLEMQQGMSLRDYFAAKVIAAFIASDAALCEIIDGEPQIVSQKDEGYVAAACSGAYRFADFMLIERGKEASNG